MIRIISLSLMSGLLGITASSTAFAQDDSGDADYGDYGDFPEDNPYADPYADPAPEADPAPDENIGATFSFGDITGEPTPEEPPPAVDISAGTLQLNSVLVSSLSTDQAFLEPEATRIRQLIEDTLREHNYVVLTMADVPRFPDYDADVYLRNCPIGQYIGCVFVVGGRAKSDWTIGGTLSAVDSGYRVVLSFIDVSAAQLVVDVPIFLDGNNDAAFKDGVAQVMDALIAGDVAHVDMRADPEAERAAAQAAAHRERQARDFTSGQTYDIDDMDRGLSGEDAYVAPRTDTRPGSRVTMADLDAMEDRGGLTPWERANLTKAQYKLYQNSGKKLRDFQEKLRGRKGQLIFRLGMDVGMGSWGQTHDTYMLVAPGARFDSLQKDDLKVEEIALAQSRALAIGGQFEFGVGVASWAEIDLFAGLRGAPYASTFYAVKKGNPSPTPPDADTKSVTSWEAGLRVGFAPLPAYPARPTFHVGASYWSGNKVSKVASDVPAFLMAAQTKANNQIFVWLQPGFEADLGKFLKFWGRVDLGIPVYGRNLQAYARTADGFEISDLKIQPSTATFKGLSAGGSIGLSFHIRAAGK